MEACGAGNNGRSMDNVCPDWGIDDSLLLVYCNIHQLFNIYNNFKEHGPYGPELR